MKSSKRSLVAEGWVINASPVIAVARVGQVELLVRLPKQSLTILYQSRFTEWSGIDIATWEIAADQTFRAIVTVIDLEPSSEINLSTCTPSLLRAIEKESVDL